MIATMVFEDEQVRIPGWVVDLESFRRWPDAEEFPDKGRICYIKGEVWVDMSREQVFTHNQVKAEFTAVLVGLTKAERMGRFYPDDLRLTYVSADIAGMPDGTFASAQSHRTGKVRLVKGKQGGYVELEGTPDMVLEIISRSSVQKDADVLREVYWEAGIQEYWLVDARREPLQFDILRHAATGYLATRKQGGWLKSAVFGKSFRLTQKTDELQHPEYTLAVR